MVRPQVLSLPFAHIAVYAALVLPVYCKLLVVDLENEDDVANLGSPDLSQGSRTMQGEAYSTVETAYKVTGY